jgi:hypothetical protein
LFVDLVCLDASIATAWAGLETAPLQKNFARHVLYRASC